PLMANEEGPAGRLSTRSPWPAEERPHVRFPLAHQVAAVGIQPVVAIDLPGRPADLELLDERGSPQSEVEPGIAGRLVAAAPAARRHLPAPPGLELDSRPDPVPVRPDPFQPERDPVAGPDRLVMKVNQRLVLGEDDGIPPAVIIEVADGQAATQVEPFE